MANALHTQIIVHGPRNAVVKITGVLDTSDLALVTIINPATMYDNVPLLNVDHVDYSISDQLELQLQWVGTPNQVMMPLAGRGRMSFVDFGGLPDDAIAPTGAIALLTTGWTSGTQIFSLILELTKKGKHYVGVN